MEQEIIKLKKRNKILLVSTIFSVLFCLVLLVYSIVQISIAMEKERIAVDAAVELYKCRDEAQQLIQQTISAQKEAEAQHARLLKAIELTTTKKRD